MENVAQQPSPLDSSEALASADVTKRNPAFLGKPTRGGKLTMANCLLWALVLFGYPAFLPAPVAWVIALVVSLPAALPCILPALGSSRVEDLLVPLVMIGVNSFVWGYGISWIVSRVRGSAAQTSDTGG